jgi:hypothetical protein
MALQIAAGIVQRFNLDCLNVLFWQSINAKKQCCGGVAGSALDGKKFIGQVIFT